MTLLRHIAKYSQGFYSPKSLFQNNITFLRPLPRVGGGLCFLCTHKYNIMCGMERESNETRELKKMKLHVFNIDMEVNVPVEEEQRYREAAEMVNRKIKAYRDVFVLYRYFPLKSEWEILLMVLLDFAVRGGECSSRPPARGKWRTMTERVRRLWEDVINFFKRENVCD